MKFSWKLLLFCISLFIFAALAHEFVVEKEDIVDRQVINFLNHHANKKLLQFMQWFTFFGSQWFLLPAYLVITGILFIKKKYTDAVTILSVAVAGYLVMLLIKTYFQRVRPVSPYIVATGYSFPSGHTLSAFVFSAVLIFLLWKSNWKTFLKYIAAAFLLLFAILVGISRVILQVHYASDVIAGICCGLALVLFSLWIAGIIARKLSNKRITGLF